MPKLTEEAVLWVLDDLCGEDYGVPIHEALEKMTDGFVSIGAMYIVLETLEAKGLVTSRIGEPDDTGAERRWKPKKYWKLVKQHND